MLAPVNQLHHAVMVELHPLREPRHGRRLSRRKTAHGQNHLILLRVHSQLSDLLLHVARKATQLIAELGQSDILGIQEAHVLTLSHFIASRYIRQLGRPPDRASMGHVSDQVPWRPRAHTRSLNPYLSALSPQQMTTLSARPGHAAKRQTRDSADRRNRSESQRNRRNRAKLSGVEQDLN